MIKIRIAGPPGTGKTTRLTKIFYELLDKYSPADILLMSHTKTAAKIIRDKILEPETILEYQKETGKEIYYKVQNSKKTLEHNVSTIHSYCNSIAKQVTKGQEFDLDDYDIMSQMHPLFNKHTMNKKFKAIDSLFRLHPFFKFNSFARNNGMSPIEYYSTLGFEEKNDYKYYPTELQELAKNYHSFKTDIKINERAETLLDFDDMIEYFYKIKKAEPKYAHVKVLILDEAQDSSVIQRKAEEALSKNVDYFYKAGDPDQSIFEFSGADPDAFHKEFANPEIELEQGYRCPRIVNDYCKKIIKDIWDHYEYSRVWAPLKDKDTGEIIEGEKYMLRDLEQDENAAELKRRILETEEKFIFTYRGNDPIHTIKYLINTGVPFQMPYNDLKKLQRKKVFDDPARQIKNQRFFLQLANGESVVLKEIKQLLKSIDPRYLGKNYSLEKMDSVARGSYNLNFLIEEEFLHNEVKNIEDFQLINTVNSIFMKNYIREIVNNNRDLEDKRIFVENIHTIKGKEFDNVVLDLTLTRTEDSFSKKRMKYVACSRAKKTLWLVKSKTNLTLEGEEDKHDK
jgi:superfamily I DNA/RNA helicase